MSNEPDEFLEMHRQGRSEADILTAMSRRGLSILEAIKAARSVFGIGLGSAKLLVSSHPSWSQTAEAAGPLHDALIQACRDAGDRVLEYGDPGRKDGGQPES